MNLKKIVATVLAIATISSVASVPVNAQGWVNSNNAIYYQLSNGNYATGWAVIGNYKYYFKSNGKAATGFQKIGDNKYCFDNKGRLCHGVAVKGDKAYIFGADGALYGTMSKTNYENLKARSPEEKFISTEPIQYNSKGKSKGYITNSFYSCLDSNFYKLFGYPSTKSSVIKNMGKDDKYITYMLYAYMNQYCLSSKTYKSYKNEAYSFLKSIVTDGEYYYASGDFKGYGIKDLKLCRPLALLKEVDFAQYVQDGRKVDMSKIAGNLSSFYDYKYADTKRMYHLGDDFDISKLEIMSETLYYDLGKDDDFKSDKKYARGELALTLDNGDSTEIDFHAIRHNKDFVITTLTVYKGKDMYELRLCYSPITGKTAIWVYDYKAGRVHQFKTLAAAEEYIWG